MMNWLMKFVALIALAVGAGSARAEWKAAETAHFVIYSDSSDKEIEKLAARLESYHKLMLMATGVAEDVDPVKVRIYEVASTHEVGAALGLTDSGIGGFYTSNVLGPFAVTPRKMYFHVAGFTPELVLHHEYAHHFMLQYFPASYPGWYTEGFAELIGSSKMLDDGTIGYGMPAKHRGNEIAANWVSLEDLLTKDRVRGLDAYGQGWALTHFFTFDKARADQLRRYLHAISTGKSRAEAAKVFGDLGALNREARRYVTTGSFIHKRVKPQIERPAVKSLRRLSPAEAALIPQTIALSDEDLSLYRKASDRKREQELRDRNLARIRETAGRFPNDPYAIHLLAEAEWIAGNHAAAEAAADRLLALQPGHVRGMVRKSMSLARAAGALSGAARTAKAAEARKLALKANAADPNDPLPLLAYYQSFKLAGETPNRQAVDSLAQAVHTLPRDLTIRQLLVDEFAAQKKWAKAIEWLTPMANSPHESPRREAAREQMAKLQAELAREKGETPPSQDS
jgi:tetratricopeptide (TPR) repeat protein